MAISKSSRRLWLLLLGAVVLPFLLYAGAWYFLPLQAAELSQRWMFWREGVKQVESAGLHGYLHDTCAGAPPSVLAAKGCTCVAMIHGLADNALTWKNILLWPANGWIDPVKLYAFDLPGSGRSAPPASSAEYRVRAQARRLKDALAPLCPRWVVVGNSLGGWIGAWVALDWSEGVSRLLLLGSAGLKGPTAGGQEPELRSIFVNPSVESLKEFQARAYFKGRALPDRVWRAAVERMKASNAREVIAAQTPEDELDGRLPALRKPTLLLWGKADRIEPPEVGLRFKSLIRGSIWQEVPDCGHLPQKECPLEVIRGIGNMINYGGV